MLPVYDEHQVEGCAGRGKNLTDEIFVFKALPRRWGVDLNYRF